MPDWSPDGNQILFAARSGSWDIYVINADGSGLRNLTNTPDIHEYSPSWSPNGKSIAFSRGSPTTKPRSNGNGTVTSVNTTNIFVMNSDGSNAAQLTNEDSNNLSPKWSPDGRLIAFVSNRIDGSPEIFVMNADGLGQANVTDFPERGVYGTDPTWSPDGRFIAFTRHSKDRSDIFIVDVDGDNLRQLTHSAGQDSYPAWSPNGQWIAFVTSIDRTGQIHLLSPDGTNTIALTDLAGVSHSAPAWSPDGKFIVCQSSGFPENPSPSTSYIIWEGGGLSVDLIAEGVAAFRYGVRHEDGTVTFQDLTEEQARIFFRQQGYRFPENR
jgi:TolB protein